MLNQLTISELAQKLAKRELSARAVTQACLDRIQRIDGQVRAFISFDAADALAQADEADRALASGATHAQRPLLGVPVAMPGVVLVSPVFGSIGWSLGFGMTIQRISQRARIPPTTAATGCPPVGLSGS